MMDSPRAPESERTPPDRRGGQVRALFRNVWDTAKVFLVSLAIIVPIRAYVVQPFFVRGASMAPSFLDGEYLVIDELSYDIHLRPLQRGDVIVFRYPLDHSQYYIKRILGLPGERVRIAGGQVTIANAQHPRGFVLDESPYLPPSVTTDGTLDVQLRPDEVFILGDNRNHSSDSRAWGPLPTSLIIGRAWVRAFPFSRARVLGTPWYGALAPAAETLDGGTPHSRGDSSPRIAVGALGADP